MGAWITGDAAAWAERVLTLPRVGVPTMRAALLVSPEGFGIASQSAQDNLYVALDGTVDRQVVQDQHDRLVAEIRRAGVPTLVLPGPAELPDAVFPNNVYGFAPGVAVLASMRHPVRRAEAARKDARALFTEVLGRRVVDLSSGPVGELTGVLAIDRTRGAAICGLTGRCEPGAVASMASALGLEAVLTTPLIDEEYHLNVVLAVLEGRGVVMHDGAFEDPDVPSAMDRVWPGAVLHLSSREKDAFAANCLSVAPGVVAISTTAERALTEASRDFFSRLGLRLLPLEVDGFEVGGGSLRCLVAEVF